MDHSVSDTALELSTLKLGMDRSIQDLRIITFKYFLSKIGEEDPLKELESVSCLRLNIFVSLMNRCLSE